MKRQESEIIKEIARTFGGLSPENLYRDGEASQAEAKKTRGDLTAKLNGLFRELGRRVGEVEAYELASEYRKAEYEAGGFVPLPPTGAR